MCKITHAIKKLFESVVEPESENHLNIQKFQASIVGGLEIQAAEAKRFPQQSAGIDFCLFCAADYNIEKQTHFVMTLFRHCSLEVVVASGLGDHWGVQDFALTDYPFDESKAIKYLFTAA